MSTADAQMMEASIMGDIEEFLDLYNDISQYGLTQLTKYTEELKKYTKTYRQTHAQLKRLCNADEYPKFYSHYDSIVEKTKEWFKGAAARESEITKEKETEEREEKARRREKEERKETEEKEEKAQRLQEKAEKARRLQEEKEEQIGKAQKLENEKVRKAKIELKNFIDKVEPKLTNIVDDAEDLAEIVESIKELGKLEEKQNELQIKCQLVLGDDYENEFRDILNLSYDKISASMKTQKNKMKTLKQEDKELMKKLAMDKEEREKSAHEESLKERSDLALHVCDDIKLKREMFMKRYDIPLEEVNDGLLFDRYKDVKSVDREFSEILDKVTDLREKIPSEWDGRQKTLDGANKIKDELRIIKDIYVSNLSIEMTKRDLSFEKLKNASILNIELPKFRGYSSLMDIYSFQTEFEKLISPRIQTKLLPEYLKRNYLEGPALLLVKEFANIDTIWAKLKESFGCANLLLQNKLSDVRKVGPIWKIKDDEKLIPVISQLVNAMSELQFLVEKHGIKNDLYNSYVIGIIYDLIGSQRQKRFISENIDNEMNKQEEWNKIMAFLRREIRTKEVFVLSQKAYTLTSEASNKSSNNDTTKSRKSYFGDDTKSGQNPVICSICGKNDHVISITRFGHKLVNYFSCEKFVKKRPAERLVELRSKGLCVQCLRPGFKENHDGRCWDTYSCPHESHKAFEKRLHVLVCEQHKNDAKNRELFDKYKKRFITDSKFVYKDFSKNMSLSFHAGSYGNRHESGTVEFENAIYMLQTIEIQGQRFNLFFDSGCSDLVSRSKAVFCLEKKGRANCELKGPLVLSGVGNQKTVCEHGIYQVRVPMHDGKDINISGLCLDTVTAEFPKYDIRQVEKDIHSAYRATGQNPKSLPKLPSHVGGGTDFMIGIKYLKYFPKAVYQLPSGLTIYESVFANPDGSRGVIGGPHRSFTEIDKKFSGLSFRSYHTETVSSYQVQYKLSLDVSLLGTKRDGIPYDESLFCENNYMADNMDNTYSVNDANHVTAFLGRKSLLLPERQFEKIENAGTDVTYRCIKCRDCQDCKTHERIEHISIQEEMEQHIIDQSVTVDSQNGRTIAKLPFIKDPIHRLSPNEYIARKIYDGQVKKLEKCHEDRNEIIQSERKLQELGFVDFLSNLTPEQRQNIANSPVKHFIPWRAVWNENSISTPCRLVFDASQKTNNDYSLNCILAKGRNNMNKLVEIAIRWMLRKYAFHTDIQKMYNAIMLAEEHWCYQLYLWDNALDRDNEPQHKVIKTLIYGVKSSGNQAENGLRKTANLMMEKYPREHEVIHQDIYVDDCLSGENTWDEVAKTTDRLKLVLNKGGFCLKGLTFSSMDPPRNLSDDGTSVKVAGMVWFSKEDKISLNISELNFSKKCRGKRASADTGVIPKEFTRRECVGKVAEIFDLLGKMTPITAGMKLDLRELCTRRLDWDDNIPDELKSVWNSNFELMSEMGKVKFNRTIIPVDAVSLDIETIDTADASQALACAAIYARIRRKSGEHSCQLVFSRSKIVPMGMTMPRAELFAATLNAYTGHVVKLSFGKYHKSCVKLTDSQIVLYWLNNTKSAMRQWVRNRVIEINRLTELNSWKYVRSNDMIADLGTRKGAKIEDVCQGSKWINGYEWMKLDQNDFPTMTVNEIKLSNDEKLNCEKECLDSDPWYCCEYSAEPQNADTVNEACHVTRYVPTEVRDRYRFSDYLIDPNRYRLRKVVRVLALVMLFIKKLKKRIGKGTIPDMNEYIIPSVLTFKGDKHLVTEGKHGANQKIQCKPGLVVTLSEEDLKAALYYYFQKATQEIKHFVNKRAYQNNSKEINGILYYTGRILPSQEFNGILSLSDVSIDLKNTSFCVPLTDSLSPFAYSVVNETHWYNDDAKHCGVETVLRYVQKVAYIIEGRGLVKMFRKECARCRLLAKRAIEVSMGPIHEHNLNIAPAFFISQVDIFGPVNSYSNVNKRSTVKLWFVIFCCCTTGAIDIKSMEDYSTESFLFGFVRFACKVGYPKMLMPDEGSQLVKGCKTMKLEFYDIKHKLHVKYGVEFETCPVGAHYMHGKVERKIRHVQESFMKVTEHKRLSMIQWETIGDQVANSVNNQPIAIGNIVQDIENLDILTPNRLILGRNNDRCPTGPLTVTSDPRKIIKANNDIFDTWFKCWVISYVPTLMRQPKWFVSDRDTKVGDVVLFLKSDKEFDKQYQYGIIKDTTIDKDGKIRKLTVEYRNNNENTSRTTIRGARDIVVIHPVDELGIILELGGIAKLSDLQ